MVAFCWVLTEKLTGKSIAAEDVHFVEVIKAGWLVQRNEFYGKLQSLALCTFFKVSSRRRRFKAMEIEERKAALWPDQDVTSES